MPRVSIIMPSYNHSRFLRACVGSIQAQSFEDWELVVVDDGSPDDSVAILHELAAQDSRIRVSVNEKNLGTYGTEQRALEMATGDEIAVMNSDDLWHPDKLRRQVEALDAHPDCGFCYVLGWMVDDQGNELEGEDVHLDWPRTEVQEPLPYLLYENRILASGVLFRREGLYFETTCRYSGDWVALLNFARRGPAACVPERLTFWRQHDNNTYKRSVGQMVEEIRVRQAILDAASTWFQPRLDRRQVAAGLARNAMNLFALMIYFKDRAGARRAGWIAVRHHTDKKSALKRTLSSFLPAETVRNYFWRGSDRDWLGLDVEEVRAKIAANAPLRFRE